MSCRSSHVIKSKQSSHLIGQFGHVPLLQVASILKSTVYSFGEEGMQLCNHRNFSVLLFLEHVLLACARANLGYVAIFSNVEKFRRLYSHYGSCMPSSPKEYISPWVNLVYPARANFFFGRGFNLEIFLNLQGSEFIQTLLLIYNHLAKFVV